MQAPSSQQLGKQNAVVLLTSGRDNYRLTLDMLQQSRRQVCIFSRKLDGNLYNSNEFSQVFRHLCSQQRRIQIRILIQDIEALVSHDHRIIELSRQFSSATAIRVVHAEYQTHNEAFMIFDGCGVIRRQLSDRYDGSANFNDPYEARRLQHFFDEVWDVSEPDPNTRRLHL